jgi:Transposase
MCRSLTKNKDDHLPKKQRSSWFNSCPRRIGPRLCRFFTTKQTREAARGSIQGWIAEVKRSGLDCFDKFIATLKEQMEIIANYFTYRSNSGWVEGLNNKIISFRRSVTLRAGHGRMTRRRRLRYSARKS